MTGRRRPLGCRLECFGSPVPLLWTGVPTPSTPVDRQVPLPIFRCPGNALCCARVFPDHLIIRCGARSVRAVPLPVAVRSITVYRVRERVWAVAGAAVARQAVSLATGEWSVEQESRGRPRSAPTPTRLESAEWTVWRNGERCVPCGCANHARTRAPRAPPLSLYRLHTLQYRR